MTTQDPNDNLQFTMKNEKLEISEIDRLENTNDQRDSGPFGLLRASSARMTENFVSNNAKNETVTFLSLGGMGSVTKNMYMYMFGQEILLVDCGLGFADETMLGVDLLLPDISHLQRLLSQGKKIVGMVITHGHEDHMGALPFILPQLPPFPIYATAFTAALANEKLLEFKLHPDVKEWPFSKEIRIGSFAATFLRVTHSVPDTAHIVIKSPVGNFYHGSDFKFDLTPYDGEKSDFAAIATAGIHGIRCLISECLGSERGGYTPSDIFLTDKFEKEMRECRGKFIVTTYSSNISRINQIIEVAQKLGKNVCFAGRSLIKTVDVARQKGLLKLKKEREIQLHQLKRHAPRDIVLLVAGSQGQENSALTRMVNGEHRDVKILPQDTVVFSADPIPGNEVSITAVVDTLSKDGIKVLYSGIDDGFHVSGHGSKLELLLLMSLTKGQQVMPISGNFKHIAAYKKLALQFGYKEKDIILPESGQEMVFSKEKTMPGQFIALRNVYVDEVSGEEIEQYVLRDRQKLSQEGVVAVIAEIDSTSGVILNRPEVVVRGFSQPEMVEMQKIIAEDLIQAFKKGKKIVDWVHIRRELREVVERILAKKLKRQPLVLPVVIEV